MRTTRKCTVFSITNFDVTLSDVTIQGLIAGRRRGRLSGMLFQRKYAERPRCFSRSEKATTPAGTSPFLLQDAWHMKKSNLENRQGATVSFALRSSVQIKLFLEICKIDEITRCDACWPPKLRPLRCEQNPSYSHSHGHAQGCSCFGRMPPIISGCPP